VWLFHRLEPRVVPGVRRLELNVSEPGLEVSPNEAAELVATVLATHAITRAPAEEPQGLLYSPDVISAAEEKDLLRELQSLRWDPIVLHGRTARRSGRHFGFDCDYQARAPHPGDRVPDWLRPARERAARLAGHEPEELVEILVQQYPPGRRSVGTGTRRRSARSSASRFRARAGCGSNVARAPAAEFGRSCSSHGPAMCSLERCARCGSTRLLLLKSCATRSLSGRCADDAPEDSERRRRVPCRWPDHIRR
jgi:hypothetical protein